MAYPAIKHLLTHRTSYTAANAVQYCNHECSKTQNLRLSLFVLLVALHQGPGGGVRTARSVERAEAPAAAERGARLLFLLRKAHLGRARAAGSLA